MKNSGDDDYYDRLFSYFQSQFTEDVQQLAPIRNSVFLLKTDQNTYIMKGYPSDSRLRLQEAFTATLRKEGFNKTYLFLAPPVKERLFFEDIYFGCIEYIAPSKTAFSYHSQKNRQEGIELLDKFHQTTARVESRYRTIIPTARLIEKWTERMNLFSTNLPFLNYFINGAFITELMSWAKWSLDGMERNSNFFKSEPLAILHGDVAHHNFLRDRLGNLHLIDFDLISSGPASFDYLQYANRILPYMDWSFERLNTLKPFRKYLQEKAFLYALAYPADIFREWNRMIREKSYNDHTKFKQVMDLTVGQFFARKKFIDHLQDLLE